MVEQAELMKMGREPETNFPTWPTRIRSTVNAMVCENAGMLCVWTLCSANMMSVRRKAVCVLAMKYSFALLQPSLPCASRIPVRLSHAYPHRTWVGGFGCFKHGNRDTLPALVRRRGISLEIQLISDSFIWEYPRSPCHLYRRNMTNEARTSGFP